MSRLDLLAAIADAQETLADALDDTSALSAEDIRECRKAYARAIDELEAYDRH